MDKLASMMLASPSFVDNQSIPERFTCDGDNLSPALTITGVPDAAQSLALIVDDPDAPGGTWVHWVVWNLPPGLKTLEEGLVPPGVQEGMNSLGETGYDGPCPPVGAHRYFFKLYALDRVFADGELGPTTTAPELMKALSRHILDEAHLVGLYRRG